MGSMGGNETFSHLTHKLDMKVSSIEQMHPGGNMCVASQESSLKENSVSLDHEVLLERKRKMKASYPCLDFFSFMGQWTLVTCDYQITVDIDL